MIKKAYHLFFYKLYTLFEKLSNDGWEKWKALIVICALQGLLLIELYTWGDIVFRERNFESANPKLLILIAAAIISIFNYYLLLHNNKWLDYVDEFKTYSSNRNRIANWLSALIVVAVLGSLVFAFYRMSVIDWSKYRQ